MKEKIKTILYYILFGLGVLLIASAIIDLIWFTREPSTITSGFIGGIIFLFVAKKLKA